MVDKVYDGHCSTLTESLGMVSAVDFSAIVVSNAILAHSCLESAGAASEAADVLVTQYSQTQTSEFSAPVEAPLTALRSKLIQPGSCTIHDAVRLRCMACATCKILEIAFGCIKITWPVNYPWLGCPSMLRPGRP